MMTIMGDRCVKYKNAFNKPLPIVITLPSDLIPHVRSINGDYKISDTDESKLRRQKILKSRMGSFINANDVPSSSAITAGLSTGVDNRGEFARRNARSDYDRYSAPENLVLRDLKLITEGNNEERSDLIALKSKRSECIVMNISTTTNTTTGTNIGKSTGGDTTEGSRGRSVFKKRKTTNNKTLFPDITSRIVVASNSEPCFSAGTTSRSDFNKDKVHLPLSYHNDVDDDSDNDNGV